MAIGIQLEAFVAQDLIPVPTETDRIPSSQQPVLSPFINDGPDVSTVVDEAETVAADEKQGEEDNIERRYASKQARSLRHCLMVMNSDSTTRTSSRFL